MTRPADTPAVSIVIPVYRCADTLPRTIQSVLAQTRDDWEVIAVDDGSPDESAQVVNRYAATDGRFKLLRQTNAGACAARNTAIAAARGEFLLCLDADDFLEPDALADYLDAAAANGYDAAHARCRFVEPDGTPTERIGGHTGSQPLFQALSASNVVCMPSMMLLRRTLIDRIGLFDPSLKHCGDWDLWQRVARSDAPLGHVPKVVVNYRMRPTSLSRSPRTLLRDGIEVLRRIHGPDDRVKNPDPRFHDGYDPALLPLRIAYFALYTVGLSIAQGDADEVVPLLDHVQTWPPLEPNDIASCLFWAICFSRCQGPEDVPQFWPIVQPTVRLTCTELEKRTAHPALADEVQRLIDYHSGWRISHPTAS